MKGLKEITNYKTPSPSTVENQQHGCIKTTAVTETTPSFFAEHFGGIMLIFPHRDIDVGACLKKPF